MTDRPDVTTSPLPIRSVLVIAGAVTALLLGEAGRYGYHRDELYFLAAGRHLAWGYPDQPPLVPALAHVLNAIDPGSVAILRIPSACAAGAIVVLTALSARELGATRPGQIVAAGSMAVGAVLFGTGHLLSTATFDFLAWTVLVWLVLRWLRTGDHRVWLVIGIVAGVGVMDSDLVAFLMAGIAIGLLIVGPRDLFRSPWLWIGGAIALAMWSPYLAWQAGHGWPELTVSRSIAAGNSGTSTPRPLFLVEQIVLVSPVIAPIWIAGLLRLWRDRALRWCRAVGVAYLALVLIFLASGAKSYYLAGMFPVLIGAGAEPALVWMRRHRALAGTGFVVSAAISTLVTLPLLPVMVVHDTPIVSINYDTGETMAWPTFVAEIARAYVGTPATTAIVASNYGEAGAVDRYGAAFHLPHSYGVQDGYWYWGPPPAAATTALAIGFTPDEIGGFCDADHVVAVLDNHLQVADDEQGADVWLCTHLRAPWVKLWPSLKYLG